MSINEGKLQEFLGKAMAKAYPSSTFIGFDYHQPSIEAARLRAQTAGLADRATFETAGSTDYPGQGYDLVTHFRRATQTPFNLVLEARP